jgi:hypothetical protein
MKRDSKRKQETHSTEPIAAPAPLPRATLSPDFTAEGIVDKFNLPVTRPPNAAPLLKADTREKRLYKIASMGTPLGNDFFDEFPDMQEILALSLSISTRLLIVAICNSELAPTQRISAMRLVAALNGKQLAAEDDEPGAKPPMPAPVIDASSAQRSVDKIREMTRPAASP